MSTEAVLASSINRWFPFIVLALVFAVYAQALPAPYLWDDVSLIEQNPTLDEHANLPRYFVEDLGRFNRDPRRMGFYRPLQATAFHLEVALFGRNASVQRAINLLWHALSAIAVWLLAQSLIRSRFWAAWAALLFAVHPLAGEQVCLIANRGGLMVGALSLWTLVLLAHAVPPQGKLREEWLPGAAIVYLLALLAKPNALVLVVPAIAWMLLARPAQRKRPAAWFAVAGPAIFLALVYVVWRWGVLDISHAHKAAGVDLVTRVSAIPQLTLAALRLSVLPIGLRAIRSVDYSAWTTLPAIFSASLVWLLLLAAAWRVRKQTSAPLFAAVWFAATIAPTAGLIALVRPVAEHYYYLPAVAVPLALAGLGSCARRQKPVMALAMLVMLLFAAGATHRATVWQSEETLWSDNLRSAPHSSEVLNNLGAVYAEKNRGAEALALFTRAAAANPANAKARLNRAHQAIALGQYAGVTDDLQAVLQYDPCHVKAQVQLGRLLVLHAEPAAELLAAQLRHDLACAVFIDLGQGMAARQLGQAAVARKHYERFLAAVPDHPLAASVRRELIEMTPEH